MLGHGFEMLGLTQAFEQNVEAHSIQGYEALASNFERQYSFKTSPEGSSSGARKEQEYWSLVTDPTCQH